MRVLSDWIDSFVEFNQNSEPPTTYDRWMAIGCIASVLQRKCWLEWGRLTFYPNLYIVLIGPPGGPRKGTAMEPVLRYLSKKEELGIFLAAENTTREQLIIALQNATSLASLPDGFAIHHSSLTILNSELTVFLGYRNMQMITELTDWYDCKAHWSYHTKNSGQFDISNVWVNMIGATTPDAINESLPPAAIGGGFTSRVLFIYETGKKGPVPYPSLTAEEKSLDKKLQTDLVDISQLAGVFVPTKHYVEAWTDWYMNNYNNPPFTERVLAGYCERRAAMALKLSMIVNASRDGGMELMPIDLERAVSFLVEAERKMLSVFAGVGTADHSAVLANIMQMILLAPKGQIGLQSIMWRVRNDVTSQRLTELLASLEMSGFCRLNKATNTIIHNKNFKPS